MKKVISGLAATTCVVCMLAVQTAHSAERAENFLKSIKQFGLKKLSYSRVIDKGDLLDFENLIGTQGDLQAITSKITITDRQKDDVHVKDFSLMAGYFGGSAETIAVEGLDLRTSRSHPFENLIIGGFHFFDATGSSISAEKIIVTMRDVDGVRVIEGIVKGRVPKDVFLSFLQPILHPYDVKADLGELVELEGKLISRYSNQGWHVDMHVDGKTYGKLELKFDLGEVPETSYFKLVKDLSLVSWLGKEASIPLSDLLSNAVLREIKVSVGGSDWLSRKLDSLSEGEADVKKVIAARVGILGAALAGRIVSSDVTKSVKDSLENYIGDSQGLLLSLKSSKKFSEINVSKPTAQDLSIDIRVLRRDTTKEDDATNRHE